MDAHPRLLAVSDLHVRYPENREMVEAMRPGSHADWLLVAGDVADRVADIEWALGTLRQRFATVVWVPGNHELWTRRSDPVQLRGEQRYQHLVQVCRGLGVLTPEDPYPVWEGPGGPGPDRATVPALRLLVPSGGHRHQSGRAGPRLPGRCGVH
jgi:3',5'-cyclic AMP phosphodiesterase CpdA